MDLKTLHKMSLHSLQKRGVEQGSLGVEYLFILDISSYAPLSVTLLKLFYREGKGYFYYPPPSCLPHCSLALCIHVANKEIRIR